MSKDRPGAATDDEDEEPVKRTQPGPGGMPVKHDKKYYQPRGMGPWVWVRWGKEVSEHSQGLFSSGPCTCSCSLPCFSPYAAPATALYLSSSSKPCFCSCPLPCLTLLMQRDMCLAQHPASSGRAI